MFKNHTLKKKKYWDVFSIRQWFQILKQYYSVFLENIENMHSKNTIKLKNCKSWLRISNLKPFTFSATHEIWHTSSDRPLKSFLNIHQQSDIVFTYTRSCLSSSLASAYRFHNAYWLSVQFNGDNRHPLYRALITTLPY